MSLLSSSRFGGGGAQQQQQPTSELESQIVNTVKQVISSISSKLATLCDRIWRQLTSLASGFSPATPLPKTVQVFPAWMTFVLRSWGWKLTRWPLDIIEDNCWDESSRPRLPALWTSTRQRLRDFWRIIRSGFTTLDWTASSLGLQGKRNILKNPDPGLRQTLVKIYNKV